MIDNNSLKHQKLNYEKLEALGFKKTEKHYKYESKILDNQFNLIIIIEENNIITSKIIDIDSNEEYTLYNVKTSTGNNVGIMREEYNNIIDTIKNNCCTKEIFKNPKSQAIINYIKSKYNDEYEYLWEKFPEIAITRNKVNNKWYSILFTIDKTKIGLIGKGKTEILNLMMIPEEIDKNIDNKIFFPGYHMNKKHWITIKLDENIDIKEIYKLIDTSYLISLKK